MRTHVHDACHWRVFGIDIETCPACGGAVRIIARTISPASLSNGADPRGLGAARAGGLLAKQPLHCRHADLPDFFGPFHHWKVASGFAAMPQEFLNAAGVCCPRLECGPTSL